MVTASRPKRPNLAEFAVLHSLSFLWGKKKPSPPRTALRRKPSTTEHSGSPYTPRVCIQVFEVEDCSTASSFIENNGGDVVDLKRYGRWVLIFFKLSNWRNSRGRSKTPNRSSSRRKSQTPVPAKKTHRRGNNFFCFPHGSQSESTVDVSTPTAVMGSTQPSPFNLDGFSGAHASDIESAPVHSHTTHPALATDNAAVVEPTAWLPVTPIATQETHSRINEWIDQLPASETSTLRRTERVGNLHELFKSQLSLSER
ncbi:hypothetical protein AJ79_08105 [Helicocarpus griseus UAMH5409]|uniref:Uncharacterized protein n=1 Tax=Helicocarpus griseus UAMH5409 TaxID=1447875 RepID=A0A2B7WW32_9EURO|nr:hypothetical protein AJ79_08105 [Helicocarpus griseus UAMH5409]